jgi:hypothetical protein
MHEYHERRFALPLSDPEFACDSHLFAVVVAG